MFRHDHLPCHYNIYLVSIKDMFLKLKLTQHWSDHIFGLHPTNLLICIKQLVLRITQINSTTTLYIYSLPISLSTPFTHIIIYTVYPYHYLHRLPISLSTPHLALTILIYVALHNASNTFPYSLTVLSLLSSW